MIQNLKQTFRIIFYLGLHTMLILAMAVENRKETIMALCFALGFLILFLLIRPTLSEWCENCTKRVWFYLCGTIFFMFISISDKLESVGAWEDIVGFKWWLRFLACILLIKAVVGVYINVFSKQIKKRLNAH